jgi:hypothetical protein
MVNVALCKVCAEEMNVIVTAEERAKSWSDFKGFLKVFMIISAVILVLLGGLYIFIAYKARGFIIVFNFDIFVLLRWPAMKL